MWRYQEQVLAACEQAVASDRDNGNVRNSRGLALALAERDKGDTADYSAAIADFEAFLKTSSNTEDIALRTAWIDALKRKANPFDEALMEQLRGDS